MKPHCGYTEFRVGLSFLLLRCLRPLQAIAVALLLLGLPNNASTGHAKTDSGSDVHVYLIRGVLNVFSLGLDQIAARLRQQGIPATVHNHMFWAPLAAEAAAEYRNGRVRTIILVGHSSGATVLPDMVGQLSRLGVPVALAIGLDFRLSDEFSGTRRALCQFLHRQWRRHARREDKPVPGRAGECRRAEHTRYRAYHDRQERHHPAEGDKRNPQRRPGRPKKTVSKA